MAEISLQKSPLRPCKSSGADACCGVYEATDAESRLSYLLQMEPEELDADLLKYRGHVEELIEDIRLLLEQTRRERTAAAEARIAHLRMIQAREFCADETLQPEVRTFYAALAVERIALDVGISASNRGAVAQLAAEMEEIKAREGTADAICCELADRRGALLKSIEQAMVVFLFQRYGLHEQAGLYESDPATFEVHREVGRIVMMQGGTPPPETELLNGFLGKTYGPDAARRVLARLREIRGGA